MGIKNLAYLKVLRCGTYGSVQDLGRRGYRHLGIPLAGALDENAAKMANLLSGNPENMAVLELIGPGWEIEFSDETIIAVCGADWSPEINLKPISLNQSIPVIAGSVLSMKQSGPGRIAYVSVHGGIQTAEIFDSRSWHPYMTDEFMLKKNMIVPYLSENILETQNLNIKMSYKNPETKKIIAEPGPEWHILSDESKQHLVNKEWTISSRSNRMAYCVEENIPGNANSILTSAVWPGIVQLTPSGQMMILMKDAQTTGGYPRILSIQQEELNKIAQKNPGEKFQWTLAED